MRTETPAVHAGRHIDPVTGDVTLPIHLSTTFDRDPSGEYPLGFSYSREGNPNRQAPGRAILPAPGQHRERPVLGAVQLHSRAPGQEPRFSGSAGLRVP